MDDNGDSDASSELPPLTPSPPPIIQHLPVPTSVHAPSRDFSSSPSPPPAKRTRAQTKTARDPSPEHDPEMRFPRSWNDRSLLQDEPFKSWFTLRANEEDGRERLVDGSGGVKGKGKETGKEGVDWGKKMVRELRGSFGVSFLSFFLRILSRSGPLFVVHFEYAMRHRVVIADVGFCFRERRVLTRLAAAWQSRTSPLLRPSRTSFHHTSTISNRMSLTHIFHSSSLGYHHLAKSSSNMVQLRFQYQRARRASQASPLTQL